MTTIEKELLPVPQAKYRPLAHIQAPERIFVVGLGLGMLVDFFFYGKPVGIGLLLFVGIGVMALWCIGRLEALRVQKGNLWLLAPLFFFASMAFVRDNSFLTMMNVLAVVCLLAYLVFFYGNGRVSGLGIIDTFLLPLRVGGHSAALAAPVVKDSLDSEMVRNGRRNSMPILRGLFISLPILLLFTGLLASADLIFAEYVQNVLALEFLNDIMSWLWRGVLILGAAWMIIGGLTFALHRRTDSDDQGKIEQIVEQIPRVFSLGFTETIIVLLLVNLLFLSFGLIQFTYLFGGRENIHIEGFTYAEYARQGFAELVVVAIMAVGLVWGLNWITRRTSKTQIKLFNVLGTVLVLFVLVLLASAWKRMTLYESTYGYTELRLTVYVFMGWLAFLLSWFVITLWKRPDRFALGIILAAIGFLLTLNLLNPDAFIAQQNLNRYQTSGEVDMAYLTTLSDDAVPYLIQALNLTVGDAEEQIKPTCDYLFERTREADCYATPHEIVLTELNGRIENMHTDTTWQKWQSFHLSRWNAFHALSFLASENDA